MPPKEHIATLVVSALVTEGHMPTFVVAALIIGAYLAGKRALRFRSKVVLFIIIYVVAFSTGIPVALRIFGNRRETDTQVSVFLALVPPIAYCFLIALVTRFFHSGQKKAHLPQARAAEPQPTAQPKRIEWSPVIVAAIIQAIAAIVVAILSRK